MMDGSNEYLDEASGRECDSDDASHSLSLKEEGSVDLARSETRAVLRSKLLVYSSLILAATVVGLWSHFILKKEENDVFETKFNLNAQELLDGAERNARDVFSSLSTLSKAITSQMHGSSHSWPNATMPDFDVRTTPAFKSLTNPELFLFAPIVSRHEKRGWEEYAWEHQNWIEQDLALRGLDDSVFPGKIPKRIHSFFKDDEYDVDDINQYVPLSQIGPVPTDASILMLDLYSHPSFRRMIDDAMSVRHMLLSEVVDYSFLSESIKTLDQNNDRSIHPRSYGLQPVYDSFMHNSSIVGFLFAIVSWDTYFVNILSSNARGLLVEVRDTCNSHFSYKIQGSQAEYVGLTQHEEDYDQVGVVREFAEFARYDGETNGFVTHCTYQLSVYPMNEFRNNVTTSKRVVYPLLLVGVFAFAALVFAVYDCMVERRQTTVMDTATRTTALVSSLFPEEVQERILRGGGQETGANGLMKDFLREPRNNSDMAFGTGAPIADLYPSASVIFADMCGFTSWSSVREPSQVFHLLETCYNAFDELAKQRRVYKIETIGDCWVGACGLPDARNDHAVLICRFARDIVNKMSILVRDLEVVLGPDTADLGIRVGIQSGPVTAGVLRGDRVSEVAHGRCQSNQEELRQARFQLFGDTMNTAARLESGGSKNRVHIGRETAELLKSSGKAHWVKEREDKVVAKGKGELQTYWLEVGQLFSQTSISSGGDSGVDAEKTLEESVLAKPPNHRKAERLIQWNVEIILKILKLIAVRRQALKTKPDPEEEIQALEASIANRSSLPVDELQDFIILPGWKRSTTKHVDQPELDKSVAQQLHSFVRRLVSMYRDTPFHNFEHASHVTMSVSKLLGRIVQPSELQNVDGATLHDFTYGMTSDPLTQLSALFSALIHDAEHEGVANDTLVQEKSATALRYRNKSPAEQRSIECAWKLLQEDCYLDLRRSIYSTKAELLRFRQLVVCCVMATDIADKKLGADRKDRWNLAFSENSKAEDKVVARNRKATIVLEYLIQASDVSHCMQHWHVYRRWNENLFHECTRAFEDGRTSTNPAKHWFVNELAFFDFYILPLARKLKECGVFGVSSDEYLNYATSNRQEWEARGKEIVNEMVEKFSKE